MASRAHQMITTMVRAFFPVLLLLLLLGARASAATGARRPLFREYIGANYKNVSLADVPVHPGVDFHFILAFAIDYAADPTNTSAPASPTDGRFVVYWDEAHLTPAAVAAAKHCSNGNNVRVALSLGGDTVHGANATFRASSVDAWLANAIVSLTDILTTYGLDGIDVDYEHFGESPEVFAECIGQLVRALRALGVISFASIAPFANPDVQAHYGELWRRYGPEFDYVNFQFYAYNANTTVTQFLGYYDEQSSRYAGGGGKVLLGLGTDPAGGGLRPDKGFFRACRALRSQGRLHGVFAWAADNSVADGFRYERVAQRFLAGDAPGFT
ncbi:Chitinase 1 [Dichanthelium oligosanthes]|uniref:Chitinase 1 n=1 Tax=Dichanthelium oligosanthes TaxID=888268 RepID=A0A1E5UYB1_9POAL|nr:Chitinase 1 [Dichanthelium oligosanthes]